MQATQIGKRASLSTTGFAVHIALAAEAGQRAMMARSATLTSLIEHEHAKAVREWRASAPVAPTTLPGLTAADIDTMLAGVGA